MALSSGENILLTDENNELWQKWYYYELETSKNYSGAIAIENKNR